jgi:hypothetical protein
MDAGIKAHKLDQIRRAEIPGLCRLGHGRKARQAQGREQDCKTACGVLASFFHHREHSDHRVEGSATGWVRGLGQGLSTRMRESMIICMSSQRMREVEAAILLYLDIGVEPSA